MTLEEQLRVWGPHGPELGPNNRGPGSGPPTLPAETPDGLMMQDKHLRPPFCAGLYPHLFLRGHHPCRPECPPSDTISF